MGAGINQSLFVIPRWFESPPESLAQVRERSPAKFWVPLQLSSAIALVSAFALNRGDPARRRPLAAALGLYVATWAVTAAYFAPEIIRLSKADGALPHPRSRSGASGGRSSPGAGSSPWPLPGWPPEQRSARGGAHPR